ncbi:Prenylated rab acceptor PRA1 [Dillenia turbinata]|uniref:PRA1 family protein n=1 Tax=Dillenia turbinata TaxID=194707 RepID=A0AAN8UIW5_9MAGN
MTSYGTIPTASPGTTNLEFISRGKERLRSTLGTRRPWKEMFNFRSFNLPSNFSDATGRIRSNLAHFRMNYAIIVLVILFLSLLWHPISLIVFVVMMVAWLFLYFLRDEPLAILGRTINDLVVLIVLSVLTIVFLLLTGVTWNIVGSVLIGAALVVAHAAVRRTDDLFADEEAARAGLLAGTSSSPS